MKIATDIVYWIAMVTLGSGLVSFVTVLCKKKIVKVTKIVMLLSVLCLALMGLETYFYLNYLGYLNLIFDALSIWFGVMLWKLAYRYSKPVVIISPEYAADEKRQKEEIKLETLEYSVAGGMEGGYYILTLEADRYKSSKVTAELKRKEGNGAPEKHIRKKVHRNCALVIEDILTKYNMKDWQTLPKSELEVLDAPTASLTATFLDKTSYMVSDDKVFANDDAVVFDEINKCILQYMGL